MSGLVRRYRPGSRRARVLSARAGRRPNRVMRSERIRMNRRIKALTVLAVAAVAAAGCGGGNGGGGGTEKTLVVGVDLPFQGASKDASDDTWNAMNLYLEQQGGKAGKYKVALKKYDNSTAAKGAWDDATCSKNASDH